MGLDQRQDIWITAYHVPGVKNTLSDLRSLFYNNKEWYLNKRVAKSLFDQFGKPEIDLSASHLNTKCSKYASYKPDPDAYHVNAFSLCCLNLNSNIFPPFSIAGRVLQTCTGLGDSLGDSSLLANTAVASTLCAVGKTRGNTTVNTSTSTPAPATRNKLNTPNLGSAHSGSSNFVRHLPTAGLPPDVAQIIRASWRVSTQSAYNTPVRRWLDFCNRRQLNPHQPTVSQVLDFLHTLYELGLSHSAIGTHQSAISAIVEIPGVPLTLVSVSIYKRNLLPQTSTTKIHQYMRCQQGIVLSE